MPLDVPRSPLVGPMISVELTPAVLHDLVELTTARAVRAAEHAGQIGYADYLFTRIALLREAGR
jgi:hypothetical protein